MKIAIIGGGVSGLVAGYRLHRNHTITLFEANDYLGGHTHTVDVPGADNDGHEQSYSVDTGFIVFNDRTYPNLIRLLHELQIESQPTRMSFSVSCQRTGLEYRGADLNGLFAQRKNLVNPRFLRMLLELFRFNRLGATLLEQDDESETVESFLQRHRFSDSFINQYFLPMGAAIWSAPFEQFCQFPIRFIAEFFRNHGLLGVTDRPQWRVIKGGSRSYVPPLTTSWLNSIHLNSPVMQVKRDQNCVWVTVKGSVTQVFDRVIFACHADQALRILGSQATHAEKTILSAFPYSSNRALLHTDTSVLPSNRRAWACWNYFNPIEPTAAATVTYNMNQLQSLNSRTTFCVTLNDLGRIADEHVLGEYHYAHPVFDVRRAEMQRRHGEVLTANRTSFCGAYWGNGFHEDGVVSAMRVAEGIASSPNPSSFSHSLSSSGEVKLG